MAPPRTRGNITGVENKMNALNPEFGMPKKASKRKADASPVRNDKVKRSALGNLTNAVVNVKENLANHMAARKGDIQFLEPRLKKQPSLKVFSNVENNVLTSVTNTKAAKTLAKEQHIAAAAAPRRTKVLTRAAARASQPEMPDNTVKFVAPPVGHLVVQEKPRRRISNEFERSKTEEDSLYMSALESCSDSERLSLDSNASSSAKNRASLSELSDTLNAYDNNTTLECKHEHSLAIYDVIATSRPPLGVVDFDKENWDDPFQASHYAMDIFNYLKQREEMFPVKGYMTDQVHISRWMRSLLVDWMVEVQETFELNHETLYLAVKIVDQYLGKQIVIKDKLQLLGAAALFLACKYDERTPPLIDDFLYICDGAYVQKELISMEMDVFRTIGYDLGIPLSYRFLRRYARCAKIPMAILTLARYILEFSLMDYATVTVRDSQLASAALFIALRMSREPGWTPTLKYYTGYTLEEIASVVSLMNNNIHQKPRDAIKTVRNKYSHKIFFEVAKIPLCSNAKLFEDTGVTHEEHSSSV